jgi:hypothetical protein
LIAAQAVPEASDHLVEDEHGPMPGGQLAEALEEARLRQDSPDVVRDRLQDDGRDIAGVVVEHPLQQPPRR